METSVQHRRSAAEVRDLVDAYVRDDSVRQLVTRCRVPRTTALSDLTRAEVARRPDAAKLMPTEIAEAAQPCASG
ncbi:MAG TPA: hypothetical protein VED84_05850 [Acidimicrobiales bacterium]|nr:hypothetical protein [Acidimicrobiales bacterium]